MQERKGKRTNLGVGLETKFTGKRGLDLALVSTGTIVILRKQCRYAMDRTHPGNKVPRN